MSNQQEELYEKWVEWLGIIDAELKELRRNQHIFKGTEEVLRKNLKVQKQPNDFYIWMRNMYVAAMSVAVRRQVDKNDNAISFRRLLESLKNNPNVLTRSRYKKNFVDGIYTEDHADRFFDEMVGVGKEYPDASDLDKEIYEFEQKVEKLKHYVDKRIAHRDKQEIKILPTFNDLDDAIEHLERLLRKYYALFIGLDTDRLLPYWQYNWKSIFYYPWIELEKSDNA